MSDILTRFNNLKDKIEKLKNKKIVLEERAKQTEKAFMDTIKQIQDMGYNPKTLKDDLPILEKSITDKLTEKEIEALEIEKKFVEIENNVKDV